MNNGTRLIRPGDEQVYEWAAELAQSPRTISTSLLQRKYGLGYGRAARIMDQLRADGLVAEQVPQRERSEAGSRLLFEQNHSVVDDLLLNAGFLPRVVKSEIRSRIMEIGPDEAKALLAANYKNRTVRHNVVNRYAKRMREGDWLPTHQGIAFSSTGRGLDLQHRLLAVIKSGCTVQIMVTEGLDDKVFEVIDKHQSRSTGDSISENHKDCAIAKFLLRIFATDNRLHDDFDVRDYIKIFRYEMTLLRESPAKHSKGFSTIPVRSAAIVQMALMPRSADQILQKAIDFSNQNLSAFTPAMVGFANAIIAGRINAIGYESRLEMFLKACKIFDSKHDKRSTVHFDNTYLNLIRSRVADLVSERSNSVF